MTKYVSCEDCEYGEFCHQFDPFFGCENGKNIAENNHISYYEEENTYKKVIVKNA